MKTHWKISFAAGVNVMGGFTLVVGVIGVVSEAGTG